MPQFDAEDIVDPLKCKLTPYADFDGVIPEPSDKQVGKFLSGLKRLRAEAKDKLAEVAGADFDINDPDQVQAALELLEPPDFVKVADQFATIYADLCSGQPSKTQILSVPLRRRQLFYQWVHLEVLNPEADPGAGNRQVPALPSPAAG